MFLIHKKIVKNHFHFMNARIFQFVFIFLNDEVIEFSTADDTIFSDSLNEKNDDVFCLFNTNRLYEISKNQNDIFEIYKDCIFNNFNHKKYIESFLNKLNSKKSVLKEEINSKLQHLRKDKERFHDKNEYFFVKIINLRMTLALYIKLSFHVHCSLSRAICEEHELAQIIHSHSFSYINKNWILLERMIFIFLQDKFDFHKFNFELQKLENDLWDKYSLNPKRLKKSMDTLTKTSKNTVNDSITRSSIEANNSARSTQIYRNLYNFFFLFFDMYYIEVIDDSNQKLLQYSTKNEAKMPLKMNLKYFRKLLNYCSHTQSFFQIQTFNFYILSQIFFDISHERQYDVLILDFSYILNSKLNYYFDLPAIKESEIVRFFECCIQKMNVIIQIGFLQFKYDEDISNYKIYDIIRSCTRNSFLNDAKLMFYLDLLAENLLGKIPYHIQSLIKLYIKTFLLIQNSNIDIHDIKISRKVKKKFTGTIKRIINLTNIQEKYTIQKELILNSFLEKCVHENNTTAMNFMIFNQVGSFYITYFKVNAIFPKFMHVYGKFEKIIINSNKMIDCIVKERYTIIKIYKDITHKLIAADNSDFFAFSENKNHTVFNQTEYNQTIDIKNKHFRLFFDDFIIVQSMAENSKFLFQKNKNNMRTMIIKNCEVQFLNDIPYFFSTILIDASTIKSKPKNIKLRCPNSVKASFEISYSKFLDCPRFEMQSSYFHAHNCFGKICLSFNLRSSIEIYEHKGQIILNDSVYCEFINDHSFYRYNLIVFGAQQCLMRYLHIFYCLRFTKTVYLDNIEMQYEFKMCRFDKDCKLFVKKKRNTNHSDIFMDINHENNFHNYKLSFNILFGSVCDEHFL